MVRRTKCGSAKMHLPVSNTTVGAHMYQDAARVVRKASAFGFGGRLGVGILGDSTQKLLVCARKSISISVHIRGGNT